MLRAVEPGVIHGRGMPPVRSVSDTAPTRAVLGGTMAARKKARGRGKVGDLIISKSRTKRAVKKCNVGGEFYGALDSAVRDMIKSAEARALGNKRKTLKAVDI